MENLHFPTQSIIGALFECIFVVLAPIVIITVWKLKTKVRLIPFWIGCLVFPVFALFIETGVSLIIALVDKMLLNLLNIPIYNCLFAAGMAGIFEETGRLLGMKFLMRKYNDKRNGITYGIGHGGIESIILGLSPFMILVVAFLVNTGMMNKFLDDLLEPTKELYIMSINRMIDYDFLTYLCGSFERISAIILHISLSVLIFTGVKMKGKLWHYPLAIILHFLADCTIILPNVFRVPVWLFEIVFFIIVIIIAILVAVYYKKLPKSVIDQDAITNSEANVIDIKKRI